MSTATPPMRCGLRYPSEVAAPSARRCPACAGPLRSPRAQYCSVACKQRAYRLRRPPRPLPDLTALAADLKQQGRRVAHTLYECPECGTRLLGERRCADCNRFCRALGPGGECPHCAEPILLADLLD